MVKSFKCDIVSIEGEIFVGEIQSIVINGSEGMLGIMAGHHPLITALNAGPIQITEADGEYQTFYMSGGFLEVQPSLVTVLADSVVRADDLDAFRARNAEENARIPQSLSQEDLDFYAFIRDKWATI